MATSNINNELKVSSPHCFARTMTDKYCLCLLLKLGPCVPLTVSNAQINYYFAIIKIQLYYYIFNKFENIHPIIIFRVSQRFAKVNQEIWADLSNKTARF